MNTASLKPSIAVELPAVAHKVSLPTGCPGVFVVPANVDRAQRVKVAVCLTENVSSIAHVLASWDGAQDQDVNALSWSIVYLNAMVLALVESLEDVA